MTLSPLVLVPGLGCTTELFAPQIAQLALGRSLLVADHRQDDSMDAIAARCLAVAPDRFALAGLSMGGYIALAMMRLAPERIDRLALLDTNALADSEERKSQRDILALRALSGGLPAISDELYPGYVHPARLEDRSLRQAYRDMMQETGPDAYARQLKAIAGRADQRHLLPKITQPTLVMVGAEDTATPPSQAREMAALLPGARLEIIADCGHLSTLEKPDTVTRLLSQWLA